MRFVEPLNIMMLLNALRSARDTHAQHQRSQPGQSLSGSVDCLATGGARSAIMGE